MFPFVRLLAPYRHLTVGMLFLTLFGFQISQVIDAGAYPAKTTNPQLADVRAFEEHLCQKAQTVLERYPLDHYRIDLSVTLDHTTLTTTTFDPSGPSPASLRGSDTAVPGTWHEETTTSPRIRQIQVCVSLATEEVPDRDELFRSLSYALGIDLSRGDILRLVIQ